MRHSSPTGSAPAQLPPTTNAPLVASITVPQVSSHGAGDGSEGGRIRPPIMIGALGPDVLGVTLDLANVVLRGEDPLAAAQRVAPYVHLTHMRDVILYFVPEGLERQIRPCGEGVINWRVVLSLLAEHNSELHLTVENVAGRDRSCIHIYDPRWQASQPDLSVEEVQTLVRHAHETEARIQRGDIADQDHYFPSSGLSVDGQVDLIRRCHAHLRQVLESLATPGL